MRHATVVTVIALALAAVPASLRAQASTDSVVQARDETRALRIYTRLMSPFCPGLTVASCPSPGAEEMRQEVRRRLGAGQGEQTIVAALVEVYGAQILGAPADTKAEPAAAAAAGVDPVLRARLDEELQAFGREV